MNGNTDPRVKAAASAINRTRIKPLSAASNYVNIDQAMQVLHTADAADRAAGIVRVRVDDLKEALAGVYENQSSMCRDDWGNEAETIDRWYQDALIAALRAES